MKAEMKYGALKKESERFRESLVESLNGSFLQILANIETGHN